LTISQLCTPVIKPWFPIAGKWYSTSATPIALTAGWSDFYTSSSTCLPEGHTGANTPSSCVLANPVQGAEITLGLPADDYKISAVGNQVGGYNVTFGLTCTWL